jgi:hypothetical protein
MASGDRKDGGGAGTPRPESTEETASAAATKPAERPLELSSRGKVVVRSSSHPPGEAPAYSDPPPTSSTPPQGRAKRDTPAERPRGRRAARESQTSDSSPPGVAAGGSTALLWAIIVALSAALALALLR